MPQPETPAQCVERTRREQGLPPKIEDVMFYDALAQGLEEPSPEDRSKAA